MNILLIGNGFDLAHEYPTRYVQCLDFLYQISCSFDRIVRNNPTQSKYNLADVKLPEVLKVYISQCLEVGLGELDPIQMELNKLVGAHKNFWVEYFYKLCHSERKIGPNWIDFEKEISKVVQELDRLSIDGECSLPTAKTFLPIDRFRKLLGYEASEHPTSFSTKHLAVELLKHLEALIRSMEIYFCLCTELISPSKKLPDIPDDIHRVLSFNYTDLYEKIYGTSKTRYCYIHGKAVKDNTIETNNMVLGIDEYLKDEQRRINTDFIRFKKYYQRIYKQTDCNYTDWLEDMSLYPRPELHNLYIFGHSLDITDADILKELITSKYIKTTIFYINKEANAIQIENLVKVLGPDKLNEFTRSYNKRIIFKQQQTV